MSDASDVKASFANRTGKEQDSMESTDELVKNLLHRVGMDGSHDFNLLQYTQGIAATLASAFLRGPQATAVVAAADTETYCLVHGYPGMCIVVFDILLSINAPAVITFTDAAGNNLLSPMYAPNAGQGFTMNSVRGKHLPWDRGLFVQSSAAVNYGVDVSYALIER